jgi:anti-sigma regulatory factor (Ser/Thr protein kinase)
MTAADDVRMAEARCRTRPGSRGGRIAAFPRDPGCCAVLYDSCLSIVIMRMPAGAACLIIEARDREPQSPVPPDVKAGEETGRSPHVADAPGRGRGRHSHAGGKVPCCEGAAVRCPVLAGPAGHQGARRGPRRAGGPVMAASSWARAFPGTPEQVRIARRFVAWLLDGSPLRDDAVYAASELFTNGVLHTASGRPGGLIVVQVTRWLLGVRIAVTDQGSGNRPVIRQTEPPGELTENGTGLYAVRQLAGRLGWHDDPSGRTVYATFSAPPRATPKPRNGSTA